MSNSDSFIDEVNEEVRRDRLNRLLRRYGWIVVLVVVIAVGGAGYNEWRKARQTATAEAAGDAMLAALDATTPSERATALEGLDFDGDLAALRNLMAAGQLAADDSAAATTQLEAVISNPDAPPLYRDLATLRLAMLPESPLLSDEKLERLAPLTAAGAPFRLTALELSALLHIERQENAEALELLETVANDVSALPTQQARAEELIRALGGLPDNS
ncbi:MAG: tetratricopeptide repeat protein [Pseudomonadota bacterium]